MCNWGDTRLATTIKDEDLTERGWQESGAIQSWWMSQSVLGSENITGGDIYSTLGAQTFPRKLKIADVDTSYVWAIVALSVAGC